MSFAPPCSLRHPSTRRIVAVLAALSLFLAGFAQASHYHRDETARGAQTHLQCLLCLHVDRWAGTPELPTTHAFTVSARTPIAATAVSFDSHGCFYCYDARGPPRS